MQHLATGSVIAVTRLASRVMGSRCFTPPALPSGALGTQEQEALLSEEWASWCGALGVPSDITSRWWGLIVQKYNETQRAYHNVNHIYELFYQFYRVVAVYNFLFEEDLVKALADAERRHVRKFTTSTGGERHQPTVSSDFFRPSSESLLRGEGASSLTAATPVHKYLSSPFLSPPAVALAIFFHDVIYDPKAASGVNEESSAILFERFCRDCEVVSLANKLSLREAQLRAKSAAIAHAEIMREEAEAVKLEKAAVEAARRGELEVDSSSSAASPVGMSAKQMKENAYYRRLDRPERLASRVEAVYKDLQRTTPMPSATDAPSPIIQKAVEEEVMHLIRATKNHTTTSVTRQMEQVRHPAMVAVERNSELIMTWHERNEKMQVLLRDPTIEGSREAENLRHSLANLGGLVQKSLFAPHQSHCIPYLPSVDTDLGLFLDMDLSIVGVSDRARYDTYGEQIRHEYSHYPSKDFRAGRTAILSRFLSHVVSPAADANGGGYPINLQAPVEQPLFKTPLYRYWCNANARANLEREIQSLAVPELKARTITIGDVPKVLEFYKGNFNNSGSGGGGAAQHGLPSEVLSSAALSFFRISEAEMQYLTAFNFELCLMLRVEDENEMMAFLEHERQSGKGTSSSFPSASSAAPSSSSVLDIAARVQEVSRTSPPIVAAVFTSLTNDPHIVGSTQRTAQDFCGQHLIIHSIVVHSYYRRRGVGSRLIRELLNKARTGAMSPPVKALVLCPELSSNSIGGEGDGSGGAGPTGRSGGPTLMSFFERNGFVRGETQTVRGGGGGGAGHGNRPGISMVEMSASLAY